MDYHWFPYRAHCEVMGMTQSGKSKACLHWMREHLKAEKPFCLFDGKGPLFHDAMDLLAYYQPDCPVVILDLSNPTHIEPVNLVSLPPGADVTAWASDQTQLIVRLWGAENTDQTPSLNRTLNGVITACGIGNLSLEEGARLLHYPKREMREWLIGLLPDGEVRQHWVQLQYLSTLRSGYERWTREVFPTQSRLTRFVGSQTIKLFTSLPNGMTAAEWIDQGAIVLVNLAKSDHLSLEASRTFAGLLLHQFLTAALHRVNDPKEYYLYCDEAQRYLTSDTADMLDLAIASGLRLTIIHHHLDQPPFDRDLHLRSSLEMNAPIKVTFKGVPLRERKQLAEYYFEDEANERWPKQPRYAYLTDHVLEPYATHTEGSNESGSETTTSSEGYVGETESSSSGGGSSSSFSHSESTTYGTRYRPEPRRIIDGFDDYTREQVIAKLASRFNLPRGECWIKLPDRAFRYQIPFMQRYLPESVEMSEYEKVLRSNLITPHDIQERLREAEARLLQGAKHYESKGKSRPVKKTRSLFTGN
jgi:hypothetical protein